MSNQLDFRSNLVIDDIVAQHAEMAAHLWFLRDFAVHAAHYTGKDLKRLDGRLDAHLDGLRIAGHNGLRLCTEQMTPAEPGTFFATATMALEQNRNLFFELLAMAAQDVQLARPLVAALCWQDASAAPILAELMNSFEEIGRYVGLAATACLRLPMGSGLEKGLQDASPLVRARALRAVGEYGRVDLWHVLHRAFDEPDLLCRYYAAFSAALLGQQAGVQVLWELAQSAQLSQVRLERTVELVALCLSGEAAWRWHQELLQTGQIRLALWAARSILDPALVPWLLEQMEIPQHARLAGEAFCLLTGVDLARQDLETDAPAGFAAGPNDDPADEDVAMDPDEDLAWPSRERVERYWRQHGSPFRQGQRYLRGQEWAAETLKQVLRSGTQSQRRLAALALARIAPPLIEIRARPGGTESV